MKKCLLFILLLSLSLALISCTGEGADSGCTEHTDKNLDKKCDVCGEDLTPSHVEHTDEDGDGRCDGCDTEIGIGSVFESIPLIKNGKAEFRFVLADGLSGDVQNSLHIYLTALRDAGVTVTTVGDSAENYSGTEVLIGGVKGRSDKYVIDKYSLGKEGFVITAIDNKIVIDGGDVDSLIIAIELFFENTLGIIPDTENEISDVTFEKDDEMIEIQDNYSIVDVRVSGESIRGGSIAVDKNDELAYDMAYLLHDALYTSAGIVLEIIPMEEAREDSIVITKVPDDGKWGFKIYTSEKSLRVECAYANAFRGAFVEFINKEIKLASGVIDIDSDYLYTKNVRIVKYEDFGAEGDGDADDFFAIKAAHDYANEGGQTVIGTPGRTYRIHNIVDDRGMAQLITIKTDVIWERVNFIIDDTGYTHKDSNNKSVFSVRSDYSSVTVKDKATIEKIFSGGTVDMDYTGRLNWSDFGYEALVLVQNANHKIFIRSGSNANGGTGQKDIIVVGKDGKIRDETPFMFDYTEITSLTIYRMDERHITIKGGKFTTIANDTPQTKDDWGYFSRGFSVDRSYTTVDGLEHYIKGELPGVNISSNTDPKGAPYSGFFHVSYTSDVKYINGVLTGRRCSGIAGTYGFQASYANNLYLYNVKQSNYYKDDGVTPAMDYKYYWGIGNSNFCKNLTYDTCLMSRFDAHQGLYNGKVINSTITNFEIIGAGNMLIENTVITPASHTPIMLRGDYGYTWRGTLTIKDVTVKQTTSSTPTLVSAGWSNHYYGYECYFPNIIVDNLKWEGAKDNEIWLTSFATDNTVYTDFLVDGSINTNIYIPPEFLTVKNPTETKIKLKACYFFMKSTSFEGIELAYSW